MIRLYLEIYLINLDLIIFLLNPYVTKHTDQNDDD